MTTPQGLPTFQSALSVPTQINNFTPIQSGRVVVSNAGSAAIVMTGGVGAASTNGAAGAINRDISIQTQP